MIELDIDYAQRCINKNEPISAHISDMLNKSVKMYNEKFNTNYSPGLFALRIKAGVLQTKLKAGARGRKAGVPLTPEQKAVMQAGREGKPRRKKRNYNVEKLKKNYAGYENLVEKAAAGSKTAAIKLNCLDCVCFQPLEVKLCPDDGCIWHAVRPFQRKAKND